MMILKNSVKRFKTRASKRCSDSFTDRRVKPCYQSLHLILYSQSSQNRVRNETADRIFPRDKRHTGNKTYARRGF